MKVIITISSLKFKGGVVKIFRGLKLNRNNDIDYFIFMKPGILKNPLYLLYRIIVFAIIVHSYDVVHLNPSFNRNALWRDYIFLRIAKLFNKKVLVFFHGWDENYEIRIHNNHVLKKTFQYYNKSDAFIVLGKIFREKLISLGISSDRRFYFESTLADDEYFKEDLIRQRIEKLDKKKEIQLLFISRLVRNKGMNLALDIFKLLQIKLKNIKLKFIIAGDGEALEATKKYAKKIKAQQVVFTGYIENEKKHKVFLNSDIMLFPTKYGEGLPNSIMEGCLYGMPIITRDVGGIGDWIKNGVNGYISKSMDPIDFVDYLDNLLRNPIRMKKISETNMILGLENFTTSKMRDRLLKYYSEINYV